MSQYYKVGLDSTGENMAFAAGMGLEAGAGAQAGGLASKMGGTSGGASSGFSGGQLPSMLKDLGGDGPQPGGGRTVFYVEDDGYDEEAKPIAILR